MRSSFFYGVLASLIFGVGILFYYLFREQTIVQAWLEMEDRHLYWRYVRYVNWFPSFAHVFSFSLFTWLMLEKKYLGFSILFWIGMNGIVEMGQSLDPYWLSSFPRWLQLYFLHGTYSHYDMLAIIGGGLMAFLLARFV